MKYYNYPDPRGTEVAEDVDSKNISEFAPGGGGSGGGTPVGQILWQGTVTSTPQEVVDGLQAFNFLPVAVATLNGKIARFSYAEDETEVLFEYVIEGVALITFILDLESHKVFVVAEGEGSDSGIDVVIADVGNRCYIADATYQADSIYINNGNVLLFNQLVGIGAALFIHISGTYNNVGLNTMLPATMDNYSGQLHLSTIGSCRGQNVNWTIDEDGYIVGSINNGGEN